MGPGGPPAGRLPPRGSAPSRLPGQRHARAWGAGDDRGGRAPPVPHGSTGPAGGAGSGPRPGDRAAARRLRGGTADLVRFVPNDEALARLDGALAGLSLLHDVANFRPSMPTKVVEYLAHGVPAITTPLPVAAGLVRRSDGGVVVPFGDVDAVVDQIVRWHEHPTEAVVAGRAGHRTVAAEHDWAVQAPRFVALLRRVAAGQNS
nr:glycosyltransferase [Ornithinimicrobium sp. CNJ-824]